MSKATMNLGYSPLTNSIQLAKMVANPNGVLSRVGNAPPIDVTNKAAQLVWQLVMDEGGEISWNLEDGTKMVLKASKEQQ